MYLIRSIFAVLVLSTGGLGQSGDVLQSRENLLCLTNELWKAKEAGGAAAGSCLEGDCDIPEVRDAFLVDQETLFLTVRVHMLVFRENDGSNPAGTPEEIEAQLNHLNERYAQQRIRFRSSWEYVDDSSGRHPQNIDVVKQAHAVEPAAQCNIFVTEYFTNFGTFPWDPDALNATGGIVLSDAYFSTAHLVIVHEMGHNLGLWHTHHGVSEVPLCSACYEQAGGANADTTGDLCSETPPTPSSFGNCGPPGGNDSCSGLPWGHTQPENYMSYGSPEGISCWELFTAQQGGRMHCWFNDVLSGWLACGNGLDCNGNLIPDDCDIEEGTSPDMDGNGIPDECGGCPADLDGSGSVEINDMLELLAQWGNDPGEAPDFDGNGIVDIDDLLTLLASWGSC